MACVRATAYVGGRSPHCKKVGEHRQSPVVQTGMPANLSKKETIHVDQDQNCSRHCARSKHVFGSTCGSPPLCWGSGRRAAVVRPRFEPGYQRILSIYLTGRLPARTKSSRPMAGCFASRHCHITLFCPTRRFAAQLVTLLLQCNITISYGGDSDGCPIQLRLEEATGGCVATVNSQETCPCTTP